MPSFQARVVPSSSVPNGHIREHCLVHRAKITAGEIAKAQQVRVERYAADGITLLDFALYTIADAHDEAPDVAFVGYEDPESTHHDLRDRLGQSGTDAFNGKINSQVPDASLPEETDSGFREGLTDNGRHRGLIVIAPHGGDIERHTGEKAARVRERLSSKCVSVWLCRGFKEGGGAFDRWHITSTDISEESFPKLKAVIGRRFEYAVAFHGWSEASVYIGGSASPELKNEINTAVRNAIADLRIEVKTDDEGCPGAFNGNDPRNIVNRLASKGVQIEQSKDARTTYGMAIADAVADVISPKIKVCTAPVFEGSIFWTCLMQSIGVAVLAIPSARESSLSCEFRRLLFRIRNCRRGNSDPCLEL